MNKSKIRLFVKEDKSILYSRTEPEYWQLINGYVSWHGVKIDYNKTKIKTIYI